MTNQNSTGINDVGERVKAIRKALGLSGKDFAEGIGVSGSYLFDVEAGKTKPGFQFCSDLAKIHKVDMNFLISGEGEMFVNK